MAYVGNEVLYDDNNDGYADIITSWRGKVHIHENQYDEATGKSEFESHDLMEVIIHQTEKQYQWQ